MALTKELADYALGLRYEDIPERVLSVQRHALLDMLGVMLGAVGLGDGCRELLRYVRASGSGRCLMVGTNERSSPENAALVNGALAHALDFEDSQDRAMQHSNAVPTPVVLTLADLVGGVSGKELLTAMVVGSDIACRLAMGLDEDLTPHGWYMQPVHGSMGAVFAGARILGLDAGRTLDAIATNMYQSSGSAEVINSEASLIRAIRDGLMARSAVFSLLLAKSGLVTRFDRAFEGSKGYFAAYAPGKHTLSRVTEGLGKEFQSEYVGFKPWPCCRLTHPAVGGLLEIMDENSLVFGDIEHIRLVMHPVCSMVVEPRDIKYAPKNTINAKFSVPFSLGVAAKKRSLTLADFEGEAIAERDILDFCKKVSVEFDSSLDKSRILRTVIEISAKGLVFKKTIDAPDGSPEKPMTEAMFADKFRGCAGYSAKGYTDAGIDALIDKILHIDALPDARELLELL